MKHEVTVGQAAKIADVPVDALRQLCDEGVITAAQRKAGHWYLPVDAIPDRDWVRQTFLERYRSKITAAQTAVVRLQQEVEAVQLDLVEAADDTDVTQPLGNDVRTAMDRDGALSEAITALREAALWVALLHRRVRQLEAHGGPNV